jgi:hypothetical protein
MKLQNLKENLNNQFNKDALENLASSLEEVSNRWSKWLFTASKLIGSLFMLVALIATIVASTEWFIVAYGTATFIFVLVLSSFAISVLTTFSARQVKVEETPKRTTRARTTTK